MNHSIKLVNNTSQKSESNICFVNTAVQLLNSIPRIKTFIKSREYKLHNESKRLMKICDELSRILNSEGRFSASAGELRRLVATQSGRDYLNNTTQQDTVEFLIALLQLVESEISDEHWEAKAVIQQFWGIEKHEKKFLNKTNGICSKCKTQMRWNNSNSYRWTYPLLAGYYELILWYKTTSQKTLQMQK